MTEVGFLDLVKPYLEVGVLGLAAIFLVLFAILALKRFIEREKELIDTTNKHSNNLTPECGIVKRTGENVTIFVTGWLHDCLVKIYK